MLSDAGLFLCSGGTSFRECDKDLASQKYTFRMANNNSQVPPKVLRHILAVMQASVVEYKELWLQYQQGIRYIDG